MKFSCITLVAFTAIWGKAFCCEPPNIMMSVQNAGRGALGTQRSVEFLVPLFTDCEYQTPAAPVKAQISGTPPSTAVTAHFPADAFAFSGSNGLTLDSDSLDHLLADFGLALDVNTLLNLVICTVLDTSGNLHQFSVTNDPLFNLGAPIQVDSYSCTIVLGS